MNSPPAAKATRQTFNVVIGYLGVVLGVVLAVTGWAGQTGNSIASAGVVLAVLSYCVMARPFIRFDKDSVVVSNVLRETTLPWSGISHATSRGTLTLHDVTGDRTTVWAIGTLKPRAELDDASGSPMPMIRPGNWRPDPSSLRAAPTSAWALREGINAETVDNPPAESSGSVVRWLPLPCALFAVAVLSIAVAIVV